MLTGLALLGSVLTGLPPHLQGRKRIHRNPASQDISTSSQGPSRAKPPTVMARLLTPPPRKPLDPEVLLAPWVLKKITLGTDQETQTESLTSTQDIGVQVGALQHPINDASTQTDNGKASQPPSTSPRPRTPGRDIKVRPRTPGKDLKRLSRTKKLLLELYGPSFIAEL